MYQDRTKYYPFPSVELLLHRNLRRLSCYKDTSCYLSASDGFDIRARKITVQSGETVVTLTGDDMGGDGYV